MGGGEKERKGEASRKHVAKTGDDSGAPQLNFVLLRRTLSSIMKPVWPEGATVAGKAMFVCSNRNIAYDFYKIVKELRPEWTEKKGNTAQFTADALSAASLADFPATVTKMLANTQSIRQHFCLTCKKICRRDSTPGIVRYC